MKMSDPRLSTPDELTIYIRTELARIDQLRADADRRRQEFEQAPGLYRIEIWKIVVTALGTGAAIFAAGAAFVKILG
jgi:hypothetical protein